MVKRYLFLLSFILAACSSDDNSGVPDVDTPEQNELTEFELQFIEEYQYVTFNLSPTSFGGSLNEKWNDEVKIFLDGNVSSDYQESVENQISVINDYMTDGTSILAVDTLAEANVHLYLGPAADIESLWPDMYSAISQGTFQGYALYSSNSSSNINGGRIWVNNDGVPIFSHELGHILGMGHASDPYCGQNSDPNRSFMCSSLSNQFSPFDIGIIKTLYHPEITVGKTFQQLRPNIEELLLSESISL